MSQPDAEHMLYLGQSGEYLLVETIQEGNKERLLESIQEGICILWVVEDGTHLRLDGEDFFLKQQDILFLTEFHKIEILQLGTLRLIRFNRLFYCIRDHDQEVGCKGLLFFHGDGPPFIHILPMDQEFFDLLWKVFQFEMATRDSLQYEMLQSLLKRLIILCTRVYKMEKDFSVNTGELDLYREFNYLVEMNFRQLHSVSDYAALLYKSPKTLSNTFAKFGQRTPLMVIQDRILLEAKRLLRYGDLPVKEVGYDLGFEDPQAFSRFFRRKAMLAPSEYRSQFRQG